MIKIMIKVGMLILIVGFIYRMTFAANMIGVSSWWRSPRKNYRVGGTGFSLHQIGLAFDLYPVNNTTWKKLKAFPLPLRKVIKESDHYHVQVI